MYRQFALGQSLNEFEDITVIMTVNSLFLITALLYFGAIPIQKIKIKFILIIYILFIVMGALFTYAKYNILQSPGLSIGQLLEKLKIIFFIISLIMGFFILFSFLGKKRMEKELE